MTVQLVSLAYVAVVFNLIPCTGATVIYDGGTPNPSTGGGLSDYQADIRIGDLIELSQGPALVTELTWWGYPGGDLLPLDDFYLDIYGVKDGLPSEPTLQAVHLGSVTRDPDPLYAPVYRYEATLSTPILLDAQVPFVVSIYNNSGPGFEDDWSWSTSGVGDSFAIPDSGIFDAWMQDRDYAFNLSGSLIPEPAAWLLFAVGFTVFSHAARNGQRASEGC